ncbi:hypothetical protein [Streptomyces sp. NPDC051546]|uniref:hypothetical protein n=1 Tax=Streptomyces sp. NPDC051546 TaxID=3365655 RepID=UPI0037988A34
MTTATVTLRIENTYEDGTEVVTTPAVSVPLPLPAADTEERETWEWDHILQHTGTGRADGDAWYDVEIVESTAPELVGMTFNFGY